MKQCDEALLADNWAQGQDQDAAAQLHQLWQDRIRNLCLAWTGGRIHEAQDLAQEIFLALFRDIGGFRNDAAFHAWFRALARRRAQDFLRQAVRSRLRLEKAGPWTLEEGQARAGRLEPPELLERKSASEAVFAALDTLGHLDRTLVVLCELEDLPLAEAAETLGMRLGTVKSRLSRSRKRLKALLEAGGYP